MITNKNKFVTDFQVALQVLVGLELSRQTRAGSMQCFQFGELIIIDEKKTIGDYGLHLQCPWRIINENEIIIGSEDVCEPIDENAEYDENFNWDEDGNLRDVKLNLLLNLNKLIVQSVCPDKYGGFELFFNDNICLTVFPALTIKEDYGEYWRLFEPGNKEKHHFVVGPKGIKEYE